MDVEIGPTPPLSQLEALWVALQSECACHFYLSWPWIRTWLVMLPAYLDPMLVTIRSGGRIISLALIVEANVRRHGVVHSKTWSLHATGIQKLDAVFIEHNGLLVRDGHAEAAWCALIATLAARKFEWDEIQLRGVSPKVIDWCRAQHCRLKEDMQLISRYVALADIRKQQTDFISSLGSNTRARVRYTARSFEAKFGKVRITEARTAEEARSFYGELKHLHQQTWTDRGAPGSFANEFFESFHAKLIHDFFAGGSIQLLKLTAGTRTVGMLYNFVLQRNVYMYQSGFDYSSMDAPNKQSPGLLAHSLAIQHCLDQGFDRYDFLAGDGRYKQVLANRSETLWWGRIQQDALKFRAEDLAASCWRAFPRRR